MGQHEVIPLPKNIESWLSSSTLCTFNPKKPLLNKILDHTVTASARSAQDTSLLSRLRSVESETTEALVVLQKYVFVMSDTTWVSIYSTDLEPRFLTKYSISERAAEHFPFRFNEEVFFLTDESVIRCN